MPPVGDDSPAGLAPRPSSGLPEGLRLLIVERDAVIALDAEIMLLSNGAAVVEVASTAAEALQRLDSTAFDAALLDLNLVEPDIPEVAARLAALGVPFVFAAGRGAPPAPFADRAVVSRPYSEAALLSRLAKLLPAAR